MLRSATVPSIPYLAYGLFKFLANHPLFIKPLVLDPITEEPVPIAGYQFMRGLPLDEGLLCSIYPGFQKTDDTPASPTTNAASALYKTYDLGHNYDEVLYHFIVEFSMREVAFPGLNTATDKDLITTPEDALVHPNQRFLVKQGTREVPLSLNPPMDIIGDYLELTRLALNDVTHAELYPLNVKSIEVVHSNYNSSNWNEGTNVVIHRGYVYLRISAFTSRGWRDKFILPLEKINLQTNRELTQAQLTGTSEVDSIIGRVTEQQGVIDVDAIPLAEKGAPNGVATLDARMKIQLEQLPDNLIDQENFFAEHNTSFEAHPDLRDLVEEKQAHTPVLDSLNQAAPAAGLVVSNGVQYSTTNNLDGGSF